MKKISIILVCILVIISTLFLTAFNPLPQGWVAASTAPTRTPRAGQQTDQELSFTLQREQNWLDRQAIHLTQATTTAQKAQTIIDKAKSKGVDVRVLQDALTAFNSQIVIAKASHDQAAGILSTHAGFDANHGVIDAKTAHQTVLDGRNALRQAHLTLVNAVLNLRTALQNWRTQNNLK